MSIGDVFKMRKAMKAHKLGNNDEALSEYGLLFDKKYYRAAYLIPYSTLLLRTPQKENWERAKEVLKKAEKASDINPELKQRLHTNYAVALYLLGDLDKALALLEESHRSRPCGLTYQTLGYLYIEAGDGEKALQFNKTALEYDEEDPIVLDNLGQTYYRMFNDREEAKKYFEKALSFKSDQIDTLYFLSLYDIETKQYDTAKEKLNTALNGKFSPLNFATPAKIKDLLNSISGS